MKNNRRSQSIGTLGALITAVTMGFFSSFAAPTQDAYLNTPRAREEFPWLTRTPASEAKARPSISLNQNRALAGSPRYIEEHPELIRGNTLFAVTSPQVPLQILKNPAFAASPRVREAFPALLRTPAVNDSDRFQVAPVK